MSKPKKQPKRTPGIDRMVMDYPVKAITLPTNPDAKPTKSD